MSFNYYTIILGAVIYFILFYRLPRLKHTSNNQSESVLNISVIIPVRNEEDSLPNILDDIKKQEYPIYEVICVDDNSEDSTAQIIKEHEVNCIKLDRLQKGWKGKTWACQCGAKSAKGDILLFLDADVRLSSTAIYSLVSRYNKYSKPISILPYHRVDKQHEFFSFFFNLIELCSTGMTILGTKKSYGLYGPVLMIEKTLFNQYNGYKLVKNNVAEDLCLGLLYSKKGIDIELLIGSKEIQFRMYPECFRGVFCGWAKNFSTGALSIRWWQLLLIFIWIASLNAVPLEMIRNIVAGSFYQLIVLSAIHLLFAVMLHRASSNIGSYPVWVYLLYPIYLVIFEIIFIYSFIATFVLKTTTWKGRTL